MKIKILTVVILLTVLTIIGFDLHNQNYSITAKTVPSVTPTPIIKLSEDVLFGLINEWKYKEDGYTYSKHEDLCEIANDRVDDPYTHQGFIDKYWNYPYELSENLSKDHLSEQSVLNGWLNSKRHREALERSYTYSCVRCEGNYCVQIFSNLSSK